MKNFDVCIICALSEELKVLIDVFNLDFTTDHGKDGREYRKAEFVNNAGETLNINVSCPPKMGPVEAGMHCRAILDEFTP